MADILLPTLPRQGRTLIQTINASNSATVEFTSIPQFYNQLQVVIRNYLPATDAATLSFRFNSDSTANRHSDVGWGGSGTTATTWGGTAVQITLANDNAVSNGLTWLTINDYANTTTWKTSYSSSISNDATTTTSYLYRLRVGYYNQTNAITSLSFFASSGNITSGTFLLYGVR